MLSYLKTTALAGLGLAMLAAAATPAAADRGGDIAAGIIGGAVVGSIIGSQAAPPRPVYVEPRPVYVRPGCGELRARALEAEDRGMPDRARRLWREYHDCRGD
jgi:hypothetical protein